jgi:hypothetical protein
MMSNRLIVLLVSFAGLFFLVGGHFINQTYHQRVKACPKMFAYEAFSKPYASAFIIEDLDYKEELMEYYDTLENNPNARPYIKLQY